MKNKPIQRLVTGSNNKGRNKAIVTNPVKQDGGSVCWFQKYSPDYNEIIIFLL